MKITLYVSVLLNFIMLYFCVSQSTLATDWKDRWVSSMHTELKCGQYLGAASNTFKKLPPVCQSVWLETAKEFQVEDDL